RATTHGSSSPKPRIRQGASIAASASSRMPRAFRRTAKAASRTEPGSPFIAGCGGYVAAMRRHRIMHALAQRLWIIPSLGVVAGIVLSLVTGAIDRRHENGLLSQSIV